MSIISYGPTGIIGPFPCNPFVHIDAFVATGEGGHKTGNMWGYKTGIMCGYTFYKFIF